MKIKNKKILPFAATIISFLVFITVYIVLIERDLSNERERYSYMARNEAEHITTTVDCVMARTGTLKAMVQDHNGDTSFFSRASEDIYNSVTEETGVTLKNLAIAPDGVVSEVYPLAGNEALIGFNFLDTSLAGNAEAKMAYEQGSTILTNPFELVQGGMGMGGRAPVLLKNGNETELWGLVTVTIDYDNLIEVLGLDNLDGMGVDYALSYIDESGESHLMNGTKDIKEPVKARFNIRNLTWELSMAPEKGWLSIWRVLLFLVIIVALSGFVGLFVSVMIQLHETNRVLLDISNTDGLTGCLNRRAYENDLSEMYITPVGDDFIYVSADLNGLKSVNDTLGHLAGDELIIGAKDCLQEVFDKFGKVYRIGGDEFAALIDADEKAFYKMMIDLRSKVRAWRGDKVKELSMSIGYVFRREYQDDPVKKLIRIADERMYEEKRKYYEAKQ